MKPALTRTEILQEVDRLQPWFHCIDLGEGLKTKTTSVMGEPIDHPREPWSVIQNILPADLTGLSVLDVGCNAGFYSFEAKRRGAKHVLGVDGQRQHVRQALFVRKVLGLNVSFRRLNIYELNPRLIGTFDFTLALGIIYHLKHLVLALENLYHVTTHTLIVETAIMPPVKTPASFVHPLGEAEMKLHALALVGNPPDVKEQISNWFLPSVGALESLLKGVGFDFVEIVRVQAERAVVVARKGLQAPASDNRNHFVAKICLQEGLTACHSGEFLTFTVRVRNEGVAHWSRSGKGPTNKGAVHIGAHLLRHNEEEILWDYGRADLPSDLRPWEEVTVHVGVRAPTTPGHYIIEFDAVAEHIAWFEDFGSGTLRHNLTVVHYAPSLWLRKVSKFLHRTLGGFKLRRRHSAS